MLIKNYKEMTREERYQRQREWTRLLREYCPPLIVIDEETGEEEDYGHPCDRGHLCDRCHYDYELKLNYVKTLIELGLPITEGEYEDFKSEFDK